MLVEPIVVTLDNGHIGVDVLLKVDLIAVRVFATRGLSKDNCGVGGVFFLERWFKLLLLFICH